MVAATANSVQRDALASSGERRSRRSTRIWCGARSRRRPARRTRSTASSSRLGERAGARARRRSAFAICGATSPASRGGSRASDVARKLAVLRALFRVQVELGSARRTPRSCCSSPKRPQRLPSVLKPDEVAALLDRIPASTPLELRDRALFELAYSSGLRAEELVSLELESIDFDAEIRPRRGQGLEDPARPGRRARAARARALPGARTACARGREPTAPVAVQVAAGGCRPQTSGGGCGSGAGRPPPARPRWSTRIRTPCVILSPLICSREAQTCGDPGTAWPRNYLDYPGLHSGRVARA